MLKTCSTSRTVTSTSALSTSALFEFTDPASESSAAAPLSRQMCGNLPATDAKKRNLRSLQIDVTITHHAVTHGIETVMSAVRSHSVAASAALRILQTHRGRSWPALDGRSPMSELAMMQAPIEIEQRIYRRAVWDYQSTSRMPIAMGLSLPTTLNAGDGFTQMKHTELGWEIDTKLRRYGTMQGPRRT
jgi:hypothetical protein